MIIITMYGSIRTTNKSSKNNNNSDTRIQNRNIKLVQYTNCITAKKMMKENAKVLT